MSITKSKNQDTNINISPDSNTNMEKNHNSIAGNLRAKREIGTQSKIDKSNKDIALNGCKEDKPANNLYNKDWDKCWSYDEWLHNYYNHRKGINRMNCSKCNP